MRIAETSPEGIGSDAQQGKPDGSDHAGRDDGWDEPAPPAGDEPQTAFQASAYQCRPQNGTIAVFGSNDTESGNKGEADSHDDGQAAAQGSHWEHLEQGSHASHDHGSLDQGSRLFCGHLHGAGDDQDGSDIGHKHGQHMLEPKGDSFLQTDFPVKPVNGIGQIQRLGLLVFLFHRTSFSGTGWIR